MNQNNNRRRFLLGGAAAAGAIALNACGSPERNPYIKQDSTVPVTPPGSESTTNFNEKCTACHLCVNECPSQVIQPAWHEYGLEGIFQPKMDYHTSFCTYDCVRCSQVCPTGAIKPIDFEEKKKIQIGKAELIFNICVVFTDNQDCGACAEHCPTQAVSMEPYGNIMRPVMEQDICVGCGACEYICPVRPHRAILVVSNKVHQPAKLPEVKNLQEEYKETDDFPF